jgi:acetaldehyde dehydrogenase (acetylating)
MAYAGQQAAESLARLSAGETGMGRLESKIQKNRFAVENAYEANRSVKTTGIVGYKEQDKVYEIAQPFGLVAAFLPITSPTATALFISLVALQARNCVVFVAPRGGVRCAMQTVDTMHRAAVAAGVPAGCLACVAGDEDGVVSEAMTHKDVAFLLAYDGPAVVTAAYRSGKPAIAIGYGNTPAYLDRSASVVHAVRCVVMSQMFDFGLGFAAEETLVVEAPVEREVLQEFQKQGAYILSASEVTKIAQVAFNGDTLNPKIMGQPAYHIAAMAGISVSPETSVLVAPLTPGEASPLNRPKLSPILALYVEKNWEKASQRCLAILALGNSGTVAVHATNPDVILEFAAQKPVTRLLVNAPASQGAIGLATGLPPSLLLGCGTNSGCVTTDNISARNLFQRKRVAAIQPNFPLWGKEKAVEPALTQLTLTEGPTAAIAPADPQKPWPFSPTKATPGSKEVAGSQEAQGSPAKPSPWRVRAATVPPTLPMVTPKINWPRKSSK